MNKNGSKGILEDASREKLLRSMIVEFDEEYNNKSKVSYKDAFEFIKKNYDLNKINFYPSYTWWKTKGKYLVDEYNMVKKKTIKLDEKERLDLVEIIDLVEKHSGDKEALIKYLTPYNDLVERLVDRVNKLNDIVSKLTSKLNEKDNLIERNQDIISRQQNLIDSLFYNHVSSERELKHIMQLEESTSEVLNYSLAETFGSPNAYLKEFKQRVMSKNNLSRDEENSDNVIRFQKKKNSVLDEESYDW